MSMRTASVITMMLSLNIMACSADKASDQSANNTSQGDGTAASGLGSTWSDASKLPDLFTGTWWHFGSFVESDEKRNVPFTAEAQKYVDAYKHKRDISYAEEGCKTPGLPIAMRLGGAVKFTYAPGLLSIYMQSVSDTRFIKMNQQLGETSPKFYGTSVGHWEGDTLVIESKDFASDIAFQYGVGKPLPPENTIGTANLGPPPGALPPGALPLGGPPGGGPPGGAAGVASALTAAIWGPHGEGMHMVERLRLVDSETMEIKTTIYDDTVWTQPYVMTPINYKRIRPGHDIGQFSGDPEEYVCTVSVTTFDPETNTYVDKDPEEMVKMLEKQGK